MIHDPLQEIEVPVDRKRRVARVDLPDVVVETRQRHLPVLSRPQARIDVLVDRRRQDDATLLLGIWRDSPFRRRRTRCAEGLWREGSWRTHLPRPARECQRASELDRVDGFRTSSRRGLFRFPARLQPLPDPEELLLRSREPLRGSDVPEEGTRPVRVEAALVGPPREDVPLDARRTGGKLVQ